MSKFTELRKLDVRDHIEKKNGLSYLTWSAAVDYLLQHDESATWEFPEPTKFGDTLMVHCHLTAFGKTIKMHLPVMDHRNHAIANPNSVDVNKAMMRCLAKAIACFGIGLYIYSGEDLPADSAAEVKQVAHSPASTAASLLSEVKEMFDAKIVEPTPAEKREIAAQLGDGGDKWFLDFKIHFGKNKGVALSDLKPATLRWYINEWGRDEVTKIWKSSSTTASGQKQDRALREALDAYDKYLHDKKKPGAYAGCDEPIRIGEHEAF